MKIFLDSANIDEIRTAHALGIIDGVTTNPSLISMVKGDFKLIIAEICKIIKGDVSVEVVASDFTNIVMQGEKIAKISNNIVIKLPVTWDGIQACKYFIDKGIKVNMTLCFSANQALIAAKVGATYISPFIGRLDDIGQDGIELISNIRQIYDNYQGSLQTQILAASIRNVNHVCQAAIYGADIVTMSFKVMKQLLDHPLTSAGLQTFTKDWNKSGLQI